MELVTQAERELIEARVAALMANRAVLSERIADARALGDLKENGDYHAAREQQGVEEAEIRRLEARLANTSIVNDGGHRELGIVFIGATVRMQEVKESGRAPSPELFKLVGEATGVLDDEVTEVTAHSPMGEALMKTRVGDSITVHTPRGDKRFKVLEIV